MTGATDRYQLIATASFGLEAVVQRELAALGLEAKSTRPGWLSFSGGAEAIASTNLWLRAADRVLIQLGNFEATDFGQLFDQTVELPWEQWIPRDGCFPVRGRSVRSQLHSVPACQSIVKKAIVERLKKAYPLEVFPEDGALYPVEVSLLKDEVTLTLDTSGEALHKRGYRTLTGEAPLKETLAAALVLLSFWKPGHPLLDPFCGTGTIPIEAALIARNLAPGLERTFVSETWSFIEPGVWKRAREHAKDTRTSTPTELLRGTDIDAKALSMARFHAKRAGVVQDVRFEAIPFDEVGDDRTYGCLIANPPYGDRMGETDSVRELYRGFPRVLRRFPTWSHYILTSSSSFEDLVGQRADRRRKLYNGKIACTYYQFHGPHPKNQDRETEPKRAFGGLGHDATKAHRQAEDFSRRLSKRARHLRKWPQKRGIDCYRIYDRDIKEVPLVVERFGDLLHVTAIEFPLEGRTPAQYADWLDLMVRTAGETLGIPAEDVFLKHKRRQRGPTQHEKVGGESRTLRVHEGGLQFEVNLSDYVDTGLFLDHRLTRAMVRKLAAGKRFLNLFCYTGSFSVYAAAGEARSTTNVDASKSYLAWLERNLKLNGLAGKQHELLHSDVFEFLDRAKAGYELAVVDPPTFSNSKHRSRDWIVERDHAELLNRVFSLMRPGGLVFFSTNARKFKLHEDRLERVDIEDITARTIPEDFRSAKVHRCWKFLRA